MLKLRFKRFLPPVNPPIMQLLHLFSQKCSITTQLLSPNLQNLCEIISGGVGNLDELEATLSQSFANITPAIVAHVMDTCKSQAPNRRLLRFFSWSCKIFNCHKLGDEMFNHVIQIFAEKKDLTAMNILISDLRKEHRKLDHKTFSCVVETLVKLGKEDDALGLFKNLDKFKCTKDRISLSIIVQALCSKGHARKAEGVVWHHKDKISIEPCIYRHLLHGWCIYGNVKEVRRIFNEMKSLGICPGLLSYNAFLRCLCNRNRKFNPSAIVPEATDLMMEMRTSGVLPNVVSYNILLSNLCRVRRVKEACRVLHSMRAAACPPDWMSYYLVIRLLYLTGRFGRGNILVDQMNAEGLVPEARFYHDLVGVLCGVERVGFALEMFEQMKKSNVGDYGLIYNILIPKLCTSGEFGKGRHLWNEAVDRGIILQCSSDILEPTKTQVFLPKKKVEKESLEDCKKKVKIQKKHIRK